jgi:hypothetical protein
METNKALYAYFGQLGIFEDNIPGHTFYQLGLIDELSKKYSVEKFDFVNYLHTDGDSLLRPMFPNDKLGEVFNKFSNKLLETYQIGQGQVIENIQNKRYSKLFLKARFRNLSTLQKKLRDAAYFERIIELALSAGYDPANIVILDTDLSLSPSFLRTISELGISRQIPSITMPGCSKEFMDACLEVHEKFSNKAPNYIMYYGNLSFDNYKEGHSKNPIINDIISDIDSTCKFDSSPFSMMVAAKADQTLENWIGNLSRVSLCPRDNRSSIWENMQFAQVSVNVSKDLYLKEGFIPARVYESVIFGTIPVSYKDSRFHPAMSFETVDDFFEICKFISDCSRGDYYKILTQIASRL